MTRNSAIDATKIGANMRAAREAKGISRAELARKVNMYPNLIRCYETMEVCPGADNLILLANALGIGLDEYVAGVVTRTPPNEWVSVEERLPESQADVLVVAFWHENWQTMIGWHSDMGKKWRIITPHGEREPGGVTHWMPLPAPPDRRPPEGKTDG